MSHTSLAFSAASLLAGLTLWTLCGYLGWLNWTRTGRRRSHAWLEGLRFTLITLLAFTLLKPEWVRLIQRNQAPEVAVLLDVSGSMQTRDLPATPNPSPTASLKIAQLMSRTDWLNQARTNHAWKPIETTTKVLVSEFGNPPGSPQANAGTDLAAALQSARTRSANLKAILLLSDGDWTAGASPLGVASQLREDHVPIFAAIAGRETPVPDLALENVQAPAYGLFGEQIAITFKVVNNLPREVRTTAVLSNATQEVLRKDLTVPPNGELQDAVIWSPTAVGDAPLTLSIPVQPDEALAANNHAGFNINVRVDSLKVLVIDSLPRWEYRYLRNALERDPGVDMHCLLFHPGLSTGGGRRYLSTFPSNKDTLGQYDVVFLGDVGIGEGELSTQDAELLRGLVEQQSSGLVLIPGRRGRQLSLANSALKDLYPVLLDPSKPEGISLVNESALTLTTQGRSHLLTRFDADERRNEELWRQLPGFFWSAAVEKARPGSEVLGVHASLRNTWGRIPLLTTRNAGSGKVLFLGTDNAWRWRRGVEDRYHYRFWSQVVRWMSHQRHLAEKQGVRLTYTPEAPQAGDAVSLQATILDASGFPITEGPVSARITTPSGRTERLNFTPVEGGWGVFQASFNTQEGGHHKIHLASEPHNRSLDADIVVAQPLREKVGRPANANALREIATLTQGAALPHDQLDTLVSRISVLPDPQPMERRIRLWSDPRWGTLLITLLAVYWTGRKLAGMV